MFKIDCIHYRGDIPCSFHKLYGEMCECDFYKKSGARILIIKLGAAGDVIRTTPLVTRLRKEYPNCEITWISYFPSLLEGIVEYNPEFNFVNCIKLMGDKFDLIYNLDKDKEACALTNILKGEKKGFMLSKGKCHPINKDAKAKWETGLDDNISRRNTLSYLQEIFLIAGFEFNQERYLLPPTEKMNIKLKKPIIGLNTGCGKRWKTRAWAESNWIELANMLTKEGYSVLLLGGEQEDELNLRISKKTNAKYYGHFSLLNFISLVDCCDLVVSTVTMAMHIAIGLNKKVIVLNNIFNKNEFELYGLGKIIQPNVDCVGCFSDRCVKNCMESISPRDVYKEVVCKSQ